MNPSDLTALLTRLSKATKNQPTADDIDMIVECVVDNRLTDDEIKRGYRVSRDQPDPWWPKPGEFLARARPPANMAAIGSEAETILQLILDHPLRYGSYNPETGTIYDRRKIAAHHGRAAGEAFGSIQGRIRTMENLADEKWLRVEFCKAYEAARADYGPPATLTPPERQIKASAPVAEVSGWTEEEKQIEAEERKAIQAGEDAIMDPKSDVHRVVLGPGHQKFLDMLSGKIQLPEPEWSIRSRERKAGKV